MTTEIDYFSRTGRVDAIDVPGLMSLSYGYSRAEYVLSIHDSVRNYAYTYTDQEWDAETGLYNYDARLNDPVLGRFLTADSINEIALNLISLTIAAVDSWILTFQSSFGIIAFNKSKSPPL